MLFTVAGQLITVAFSFLLTRIYSPTEFGLFGVLSSFPTLASIVLCLNFNNATPAAASDEDGAAIVFGSVVIGTVLSFVLTGVFLILVLAKVLGFGVLPLWSGFLVWGILFTTGMVTIFQYWSVRRQYFAQQGQATVAMNGTRAFVHIGLGLLGFSWPGLALGEIAGRLAQIGRYLQVSAKELWGHFVRADRKSIVRAMMRQRHFATVLLPPMLLEGIWGTIPIPFFNFMFGLSLAGQYFLMKRVLDMPVSFVSATVSDAFYSKISELSRTDPARVRPFLVQVFLIIGSASALVFSPLILFGPSLFAFAFGKQWALAGLLTAITVPVMVMQISVAPVARIFAITNRPSLRYPFTWMQMIGGTIVFVTAVYWRLPLVTVVGGLTIAGMLSYTVYFITAYIAAGHIESVAQKEHCPTV